MSRRYNIIDDIASWCANRELPQSDVVVLVNEVLDSAGQSNYDYDDEKAVAAEIEEIRQSVAKIYARRLSYIEKKKEHVHTFNDSNYCLICGEIVF